VLTEFVNAPDSLVFATVFNLGRRCHLEERDTPFVVLSLRGKLLICQQRLVLPRGKFYYGFGDTALSSNFKTRVTW
jgi:hypothetical protein